MIEPTLDHLTLLREAVWKWSDCEYGAPAINPKRPFGNSNVDGDLAELLPDLSLGEREATFHELADVIRYMEQHWSDRSNELHAHDEISNELGALNGIVDEFADVPQEAHGRMLRYLNDRFGGAK